MPDTNPSVVDGEEQTLNLATIKTRASDFVKESADQIVRKARENPKTAIAAGAVVVGGVIAAAAIPAIRGKSNPKAPSKKATAPKRATARKPAASKGAAGNKTS